MHDTGINGSDQPKKKCGVFDLPIFSLTVHEPPFPHISDEHVFGADGSNVVVVVDEVSALSFDESSLSSCAHDRLTVLLLLIEAATIAATSLEATKAGASLEH